MDIYKRAWKFGKRITLTKVDSFVGFLVIGVIFCGTPVTTEIFQRVFGFILDDYIEMTTLPRPTEIACQFTRPSLDEWEPVQSIGLPYMAIDEGIGDTDYYLSYELSPSQEIYVYCPYFEHAKHNFLGKDATTNGSFTGEVLNMNLGGTAIRWFGLEVYVSK